MFLSLWAAVTTFLVPLPLLLLLSILEDLDQNSWLVVRVGREGLRFFGWDSRI